MEEEIITTETAGEDVAPNDEEPSVDISNDSPSKRGRGRPKKLKVVVTDANLMVSGISNGEPPQTPRGRGRPKLFKPTEQQVSEDNNADDSGSQKETSDEDDASPEHSPKKRGRPRAKLTEAVQADGNSMEEEIIKTEAAGEDVAPNDEEPSVDISNDSPSKRGRGRPKKLKVVVTDANLMVSGISNGEPPQTPRGRGRPKLIKPTEQQGSEDNNADDSGSQKETSDEDDASPEHSPKKRGRPRAKLTEAVQADGNSMEEEIITTEAAGEDVAPNDEEPSVDISNDSPSKRGRGRPKKLKVVVTDANLMVSGISNGEPPTDPERERTSKTH
ncbi:chromatin modification-related protein EAF7-like [Gymnodraco acuticeps]|uniref:Chromatin modification-related protein EAF7-like n=1 Tax=Gymnodraco acuticeps TaxID=8218 RepID=A0A6P8TPL8_GYMAC|nr:chromatin modification-related protein EAF7-like [Gymnodraco acuticeps]XP_034066149.1 chromatin modification-related protein EAF7-like [Gymnodraco acuticeps]